MPVDRAAARGAAGYATNKTVAWAARLDGSGNELRAAAALRGRGRRRGVAADRCRAGERRYIFPYQHYADAVFDTGLVYEPSVLKVFAERYLLEVAPDDPAQATAERLLELLGEWVTIYPEHVPPTSLLREFIGGSGFGT